MCSSTGNIRRAGGGGVGCNLNGIVRARLIKKMALEHILRERKPAMMLYSGQRGTVSVKVGGSPSHMRAVTQLSMDKMNGCCYCYQNAGSS